MPTGSEMSSASSVTKLGIIAGGGALPFVLADVCRVQGIDVFVVGFEGQTDEELFDQTDHLKVRLGQVGKIIKAFKKRGIRDLVLIGSIARPSFSELIPDIKAAKFLAEVKLQAMGDSDLLSTLKAFLQKEGFVIRGVQDFAPELLCPEGNLGKTKPSKEDWVDIKRGVNVLLHTAPLDVGQSVVVQEGLVLGLEAIEGTSQLIDRCSSLKRRGRKGVLVKLCKPQQDTELDLPTIGIHTLEKANSAGLGGIVTHARRSLLVDKDALVSYADKHKLYIIGIDPEALDCS